MMENQLAREDFMNAPTTQTVGEGTRLNLGGSRGGRAEWKAGVQALEVGRREGGMLGETAVHRGYARAPALDWTHGCPGFCEWPLRRGAQIFQWTQKGLL